MEWIKRMTDRRRIHLKALAECRDGLVRHVKEILSKKQVRKAREAKGTFAVFGDVLAACREQGAGFMLQGLESCLAELDKLAGPPPKNAPPTSVALPNANWSVRQPLTGRLRLIPADKNIRDLLSVRWNSYNGPTRTRTWSPAEGGRTRKR
jgi:hypothetical protein